MDFDNFYKDAVTSYVQHLMAQEEERKLAEKTRKEEFSNLVKTIIQNNLRHFYDMTDEVMKHVFYMRTTSEETDIYIWLPKILPIKFTVDKTAIVKEFGSSFCVLSLERQEEGLWFNYLDVAIGFAVSRVRELGIPADVIETHRHQTRIKSLTFNYVS